MDKQIMIDGVDVSGCNYGEIEKDIFKCSCEYNVRSASMFCKDNPNCYYKQLKRKEQECEIWKNQVLVLDGKDVTVQITQEQFEEYNQLKAENEELKKEIINRNEKIKELRFSVSDLTNRLCDLNAEKSFRIVDLEQTLTEIKKIVNIKQEQSVFVLPSVWEQILQIIDEVISE